MNMTITQIILKSIRRLQRMAYTLSNCFLNGVLVLIAQTLRVIQVFLGKQNINKIMFKYKKNGRIVLNYFSVSFLNFAEIKVFSANVIRISKGLRTSIGVRTSKRVAWDA